MIVVRKLSWVVLVNWCGMFFIGCSLLVSLILLNVMVFGISVWLLVVLVRVSVMVRLVVGLVMCMLLMVEM